MQFLKNFFQVGGSLNGITHCSDYDDAADWSDCNVYALKTNEGLILFDSGNGETLSQIFMNLEYWSLDPNSIAACLVTHPHLDHAGGCHELNRRGVKVYAHEYTADAMASGDERCCGYLYHKPFIPCNTDVLLKDGDITTICGIEIEALHLPGHTMGCTAYRFHQEGKEILVSGDVIGTLLSGFFGWNGSFDFDKKAYLSTLARLAQYRPDIMLPGHGLIYYGNPQSRVESALNHALMEWR